MGNGTVAALIVNWHDTQDLKEMKMNFVQLLGIVPYPEEVVEIWNLWTHEPVVLTTNTTDGSSSISNRWFTFQDLKGVPTPKLSPHGCAAYSFTTMRKGQKPKGGERTSII
jgi:hypothetical protein